MKSSCKLIFSLLVILFISSVGYAQDRKKALRIIESVMDSYENEDFKIAIKYSLYTSEGILVDSYKGLAIKTSNSVYARINNTEFVQEDDLILKINLDQKAALIARSGKEQLPLTQNLELVNMYTKINMQEKEDEFLITLIAPDITQLPYTNVKITIDKDTFKIRKQELDFIAKIPLEEGGNTVMKNVNLMIEFEEIKSKEYSKKSLKDFIVIQNKSYQLTGQYADFELIDQTNI